MTAHEKQRKRAVSYIRVNRLAQGDARGMARRVQQQRRECEAIAAELGVEIVREHVDTGGGSGLHRQAVLEQVLDEMAASPVEYLVTSDLDRLSRDMREARALRTRLEAMGVKLATWQTLHYGDLVDAIYFAVADFMARDAAQRRAVTGRRKGEHVPSEDGGDE